MISIRLSLLFYFLVLLAIALGAVFVLTYQNSQRVMEANESARKTVLRSGYERACYRERDKLDDAILDRAQALAAQTYFHYQFNKMRLLNFAPLGALSSAADPKAAMTLPLWLTLRPGTQSFGNLIRLSLTEIQLDEDSPAPGVRSLNPTYAQINTGVIRAWHSRAMGDRSFPFDNDKFLKMPLYGFEFDETELEPGVRLRRVSMKVPIARYLLQRGPRPPLPDRSLRPRGPQFVSPPPPEREEQSTPAILIQCATVTRERDENLAKLEEQYEEGVAALAEETRDSLAGLRTRLILVSLATFAATVLGGIWLVRLGLLPLRRLSDAVSMISTKDFRLPFQDPHLPAELRPIVERLKSTLDLLRRAFAREKQAAADISHELRTPLAALLTTIEVTLKKDRSLREYRETLGECHLAGKQMSQLVERLLLLARLDSGADTLRPQVVDVSMLAEQCANLVRPLAQARDLSLTVERNGPTALQTDPEKLREIVTNLLHNAIEYNRPHGQVVVAVKQADETVDVEVRDSGIGIAPEARTHIFERFYRVDAARQSEGLHSGLGLAIVKGYVELMGGSITVESVLGEGSTFRVSLPRRNSQKHRT